MLMEENSRLTLALQRVMEYQRVNSSGGNPIMEHMVNNSSAYCNRTSMREFPETVMVSSTNQRGSLIKNFTQPIVSEVPSSPYPYHTTNGYSVCSNGEPSLDNKQQEITMPQWNQEIEFYGNNFDCIHI